MLSNAINEAYTNGKVVAGKPANYIEENLPLEFGLACI